MKDMSTASFKFDIEEFDGVLRQALARTYSASGFFESEAAFKYELFHQLHRLKVGGHKLGAKLPGARTCMLHAEASAINGLVGQLKKTDLLVCDPTIENRFNYRTRAVIELKKSLNASELDSELKKFEGYKSQVPMLYIVSANMPRIDREIAMRIASKRQPRGTIIEILDRYEITVGRVRRNNRISAQDRLVESVIECVKAALDLYGKNRKDPYHGFLWRNYEYEHGTSIGCTFPCEGDFVAQLYNLLRSRLRQCTITPEYKFPSASRSSVDLFVEGTSKSVGIEVKMNYDNFKGKGENAETAKITRKFKAMSREHPNHTNILVVIQGEAAYARDNKERTLEQMRRGGAKFGLMYYDERRNRATGPVKV